MSYIDQEQHTGNEMSFLKKMGHEMNMKKKWDIKKNGKHWKFSNKKTFATKSTTRESNLLACVALILCWFNTCCKTRLR